MTFLIRRSLTRLGLEDEIQLLETVVLVHRHWPELSAASAADNALDYLISLEDNLEQQRPLLEQLDIDPAPLTSLSRSFRRTYEDRLPESLQKLLRATGAFREREEERDPGLLRWKLLETEREAEPSPAGGLAFAVQGGARAHIDLEAGDLPDAALFPDPDHWLRIGFAGALNGGAELGGARGRGGVSAESESRLNYWFQVPEDTLFASAAAGCLRRLVSPFSLAAIGEEAGRGLQGLQLTLTTASQASLELEYNLFQAGTLADVQAGLEIAASYSAERNYQLTAQLTAQADPAGGNGVLVHVERSRGREINSAFSLGLRLDTASLAERVREKLIEPNLRHYNDFYQQFKPWLSPGTLLRERCAERLDRAVERLTNDEELRAALRLATGGEVDAEQLKQDASARLVDWFNSGVGIYSRANSEGLPESAAASLDQLLPGGLPQSAREKLGEEVRALVENLQEQLKEEVQQRTDSASGALVDQLSELGDGVKAAMQSAGDTLDRAFAGTRAALEKIDARIHSLVAQLEEAAKRKLSLRVLSTEKILRGRSASMTLCLDSASEAAGEFYRDLVSGNLDAMEALMQSPVAGVEILSGEVSELLGRNYTTGGELSLLGIELGAQSIVDSNVQIQRDAAGNLAIQSRLETRRILTGIREAQSAGFLSHLNICTAGRTRSLPLNLTVTKQDERLQAEELEAFLGNLVEQELLSPAAYAAAGEQYRAWQEGKQHIHARVEVLMPVQGPALQALLEYADPARTSDSEMVADVLAALRDYQVLSERAISAACGAVQRISWRSYRRYTTPEALFAAFNAGMRDEDRPLRGRAQFFAAPFASTRGHTLIDRADTPGLRNAHAIHRYARSWTLLMRNLHQIYHADGAVSAEQMDRNNQLLAFCLHRWIRVKQYFLFHPGDEIASVTIAFMGLLARAADLADQYPLAVAMQLEEEDLEPRLFS